MENLRTISHARIGRYHLKSTTGQSAAQLQRIQTANRNWLGGVVASTDHFARPLRHRRGIGNNLKATQRYLLQNALINRFRSADFEIVQEFFAV
jgi:hypothetical protein